MADQRTPFTDRFLTLAALTAKVGLGKSSIYRMMDSGAFPRPRQVGEVAVRWLESEVDAWMQARPMAGTQPGIPETSNGIPPMITAA